MAASGRERQPKARRPQDRFRRHCDIEQRASERLLFAPELRFHLNGCVKGATPDCLNDLVGALQSGQPIPVIDALARISLLFSDVPRNRKDPL